MHESGNRCKQHYDKTIPATWAAGSFLGSKTDYHRNAHQRITKEELVVTNRLTHGNATNQNKSWLAYLWTLYQPNSFSQQKGNLGRLLWGGALNSALKREPCNLMHSLRAIGALATPTHEFLGA